MDPLTAIAAFNASYAVVKTAAQNAGEISQIFAGIGKMMSAKQAVEKANADSPEKSDLELYAAKVELDQKWNEIKEILHWTGHWTAYEQFVQDRRDQEKQVKLQQLREAQRKKKLYTDIAIIVGGAVSTLAIIAAFLWAISEAR